MGGNGWRCTSAPYIQLEKITIDIIRLDMTAYLSGICKIFVIAHENQLRNKLRLSLFRQQLRHTPIQQWSSVNRNRQSAMTGHDALTIT